MNTRALRRTVALTAALVLASGCDRLTRLWNSDLEFAYLGDGSGAVDRASVAIETRVIASARRVGLRSTDDPQVTEIDVEETHYVQGQPEVIYTGRLVFRCQTGEPFCRQSRATPVSGSRPRDVFRYWPTTIDVSLPPGTASDRGPR